MSHGKRRKTGEEDGTTEDTQMVPYTPQRKNKEEDKKEEKPETAEEKDKTKTLHPRRIWSTKMQTSSKALYEIAATPQKITKEVTEDQDAQQSKRAVDTEMRDLFQKMQELNLQMKEELAKAKSSSSAPDAQVHEQYEGLQAQIEKLTQITQRHEDEIEDLRVMTDYTHEIVLDKEARESSLKMIIKAWPKETTYYDRVRVTDWLIEKPATQNHVKQEHGYYTSGKKYVLSPVSILTFDNQDDQQRFEKYAYSTFSGKWPLYYWDTSGNYVQHWKGGWHRLVVTNYISKTDLTINLALTTALHILTTQTESPYTGADYLSHRPTDKQIFNLKDKKVIVKATYDRDRGTVTVVTQKDLVGIIKDNWHNGWKDAQKDHPRFASYYRYPYAVTFAAARLDEEEE